MGMSYSIFLTKSNRKYCSYRKNRQKKCNLNLHFDCKFFIFTIRVFYYKVTFYYSKFFYNRNCALLNFIYLNLRFFYQNYIKLFTTKFYFYNAKISSICISFGILILLKFCFYNKSWIWSFYIKVRSKSF